MWISKSVGAWAFVVVALVAGSFSPSEAIAAETGGTPALREDLLALQGVVSGLATELAATKADLSAARLEIGSVRSSCESQLGTLRSELQTTISELDQARSAFEATDSEASFLVLAQLSRDLDDASREAFLLDLMGSGVPATGESAMAVLAGLLEAQALFDAAGDDPLLAELGLTSDWQLSALRTRTLLDDQLARVASGESILLADATFGFIEEVRDSYENARQMEQMSLSTVMESQSMLLQMVSNISKSLAQTQWTVMQTILK